MTQMARHITTMKQAIIRQYGGPEVFHIEEVAKPVAENDEVLVEVKAAGVNFADIMRRNDNYLHKSTLPLVIGAEVAGIVVDVGPKVTKLKKGDRIVAYTGVGGYSQYIAVSENAANRISDPMGFAESTAFLIQGLSAYLMLTDASKPVGKSIVIEAAAGGVGSLTVQIARNIGVKNIIGLASTEEKRKLVKRLGAHHAIDSLTNNRSEAIKTVTDGKGADVYFEMTGGAGFLETIKSVNQFSAIVTYGNSSGEEVKYDPAILIPFNLSVRGLYVGAYFQSSHIHLVSQATQALIQMYSEGKLDISVHKYPLNKVSDAHRDIESRKTTGKVVLEPWP
jgi:NADPH:quinone reductase